MYARPQDAVLRCQNRSRRDVSNCVVDSSNSRERRRSVAVLSEALSGAGVDEVSEVFREPPHDIGDAADLSGGPEFIHRSLFYAT